MPVKKWMLFVSCTLLFFACHKKDECTTVMGMPSAGEIASLQAYISSKGITATQDPQGFFYNIIEPGSGGSPTIASTVTISYKGTLTNGNVFDSTAAGTSRSFPLSSLILGWQAGLPLIQKGGTIDLYLPPSLGYGCNAYGPIPGNSILVFRIGLVNFSN